MKVFISWSKNSRSAGKALSAAISEIFSPVVKPFISQDIRAGSRALEEIDEALDDTDFGIICLTPSNQTEQWINYEAGALSRQVSNKRRRMGVLLIGFDSMEEVNSPMDIFQCKNANLEEFTELMISLNELEPNIPEPTLRKRIELEWPTLDAVFEGIVNETPADSLPEVTEKTTDDRLDEIYNLVKAIEASLGEQGSARKIRAGARWVDEWLSARATEDDEMKVFLSHTVADTGVANKVILMKERDFNARKRAMSEVLDELRNHPDIGQATLAIVNGELRVRTDNIVPPELMVKAIDTMSPFYPISKIVFRPNSFRDESGDDDARV